MTTDTEQDALDHLAALWRAEREATDRRFAEERAQTTLAERQERGLALADLEIAETSAAPGDRTLLWLEPAERGALEDFRASTGAPVLLWWGDAPGSGEERVEGVLARRRSDRIGVMVEGAPPERLSEGRFHLDQEAPQVTFRRGQGAIETFAKATPASDVGRMRGVLYGGRPVEEHRERPWRPLDEALNEPQRVAVDRALRADPLALVHGPPGTGKTRTLVEIVRQHLALGQRVLVTAASNAAVDNIAERLLEAGVDLVRLGHPARVAPALEAHTLDAQLEATPDYRIARGWMDEANAIRRRIFARSGRGQLSGFERREMWREFRSLMGDARGHLRRIQEAILARTPVICATATGADVSLLAELSFDLVVLDEATQAADPIALIALGRAPRAVLAGDPHQLPPTVIDRQAEARGLGRTLFERLVGEAVMLEVQHRMHRGLMAFPSASKYGGRLRAATEVEAHRLEELPGVQPDPLRPGPLVFVDTAGKGWEEVRTEDDPSTSNPGQAERTAAEVRRLLSRGLPAADLAVITPYYAQARLLRRLLAQEASGLEIDTVDAFQGREKEAVVVDLVRSNPDGALGFLEDTRRMNVALTRARRFLLVVGDSATLGHHPYYGAFLEAVEEHGDWVSAWSDEAEPLGGSVLK